MRAFSLLLVPAALALLTPHAAGQGSAERRAPASRAEAQLSLAPVVARASPAVVNVYAQRFVRGGGRMGEDPFFRRFGEGVPPQRMQQALGSGVIVRADGVIVTNHHVVEGADALKVVLADRREFDARVILADPRTDLAVLRITPDGAPLTALPYADTRQAQVGDFVIAIGNPFGLQQTVTSGIISALARTEVGINDFAFFIQTDAAINRGNSGGALVDLDGALVGINTAIFSQGGGSNGIGFAIPAEMVRRVVDSALESGRVVRPWLGAQAQAVTPEAARGMGLDRPRGVLVTGLYPDGPAARAGLRTGDVVVAVAGVEIADEGGLRYQTATQRPGSDFTLEILRAGQPRTLRVRAEGPPRTPQPETLRLDAASPLAGAQVAALSPALAEELGLDPFVRGVVIEALQRGAPAARFGFRQGDVVRAVNGVEIVRPRDLAAQLDAGGRAWRILRERAGIRTELLFRF